MPRRPLSPCTTPACPEFKPCPVHQVDRRPTAAKRGYDRRWQRTSAAFLKAHRTCVDCGAPSTVSDHDPIPRRQLVAMGVRDPDAWHRLKARCKPCHDRRTATQDGGFGRVPARR